MLRGRRFLTMTSGTSCLTVGAATPRIIRGEVRVSCSRTGRRAMQQNATPGFWLLMALSIAAHGCSGASGEPTIERPPAVTASAEELTLAQSANSDFAVDLYEQLAKERPGENLFFSPFSISSALLIASQSHRFSDAVDRASLI